MYNPHKKILFCALAFFAFASMAYAQSSGAVPNPVQYNISPETPGPNTQVTIQAQGVGTFLGDSTVTWSQNGKVVSSGAGDSTYSFTTGALGQTTTIHVEIDSTEQGVITQDFTFIPSLVDLVWEADTSAPLFYKGKSLYTAGSALKIVAYPIIDINGTRVAAGSLSFEWTVNNIPDPSDSGLGKNVLVFTGDQLQPQEDAAVDVYLGSTLLGHSEITIPASSPQVVLYDKDPLRGTLYDEALPSALSLDAKELTIQATPYFFSDSSVQNGSLVYDWTLGDNEVTGPSSAQGILTLRQTGMGEGSAALQVSIQDNDTTKLVQAAQAALQIVFGQSSSGASLFGL